MPLRESSAPNEILGDVAKLCHCISNWRSMEMPDRQWCPMFPVFLQFQQLFPQCLSIVFGRCLPLQRTSSGCFPCSGKNTGEWLTTLGFQHLCKRCLFLPIVRCFITGVLATPMPHTNVLQNTAVPSITVFPGHWLSPQAEEESLHHQGWMKRNHVCFFFTICPAWGVNMVGIPLVVWVGINFRGKRNVCMATDFVGQAWVDWAWIDQIQVNWQYRMPKNLLNMPKANK